MIFNRLLHTAFAHVALAVLFGSLVAGGISGYAATRPAIYEARMAMFAAPASASASSDGNYLNAANAGLPGVAELVQSSSYLQPVVDAIPGAPSSRQLVRDTKIELVPLSTVFRVSVRASSPEMAGQLVEGLTKKLETADIFGGLAKLQRLQAQPEPATKVAPDVTQGVGLALVSGIVSGFVTWQLLSLLLPSYNSPRQIQRAAGTALPVFFLGAPGASALLRDFVGSEGTSVAIPVGEGADQIIESAGSVVAIVSSSNSADTPKLIAFDRRRGRMSDLKNVVMMAGPEANVAIITN